MVADGLLVYSKGSLKIRKVRMNTKSAAEEYWEARDEDPGGHPSYFTLKSFSSTKRPESDRLKAHIRECAVCRRLVEEDVIGARKP